MTSNGVLARHRPVRTDSSARNTSVDERRPRCRKDPSSRRGNTQPAAVRQKPFRTSTPRSILYDGPNVTIEIRVKCPRVYTTLPIPTTPMRSRSLPESLGFAIAYNARFLRPGCARLPVVHIIPCVPTIGDTIPAPQQAYTPGEDSLLFVQSSLEIITVVTTVILN